jgi:hypothetical protein
VICRYIADDEVDLIAARYKAAKKLVDRVYSREIVISVAQEWALPLAQLLKSDAKFILYVIMNHGVRLADLIEESRDNEEVVYTVVSQDPDEINGASERLRADPVLIQYAADVRASLSQSLQA